MLEINKTYEDIEVTANFLIGEGLPSSHIPSLYEVTGRGLDHFYSKGSIYLSPFLNDRRKSRRDLMKQFNKIKMQARLPVFLYLIQRL
jgi:hypothetical protein